MFNQKLEDIINGLDDAITIAKAKSVQVINAEIQERIFNKGQDIKYSKIGDYSEAYKKTRTKRGFQVQYVDLTFETNLKQSIVTNKSQVLFKNEYGKTISKYNEDRFRKRIFAPSMDEKQIFIDILGEELSNLYAG